ncbi:MAG: glycerophosphodiester phosphodiesterase [Hyphomicrobiaceae bacterium]
MPFVLAMIAVVAVQAQFAIAIAQELHGHRGARGLLPENTIPSFERALAIGVDCLELDVGMSKDGTLVISHDPRLNPSIVRRNGNWVTGQTALKDLTNAEIAELDVGRIDPKSKYARQFPDQVAIDGTRMPPLADLLAHQGIRAASRVCLNIEIKTRPNASDETFSPERLADTLIMAVTKAGLRSRLVVQSFHWASLVHIARVAPDVPLSFLTAERPWLDNIERGKPGASAWLGGLDIDDYGGSIPRAIKALNGRFWSVFHRDLTGEALGEAHALGLKVIVWTVNEPAAIRRYLAMGVDGIITDYPDRARAVIAAQQIGRK